MINPREKRVLAEARRVVKQVKAGKLKIGGEIGINNLVTFLEMVLQIADKLEKQVSNQESDSETE